MLSTIAGSIITVAGVTFSITVLVVSQVSRQYTPRILRNFLRDRPSQAALGVLAGVFVYCLVVMRTSAARSMQARSSRASAGRRATRSTICFLRRTDGGIGAVGCGCA
jgi:uncharacterized membrane protein